MVQSQDILTRLNALAHTLRQRRRLRLTLRALWLALVVWSLGLLALLLNVAIAPQLILIGSLLVLGVGLAYAWFSHPSLGRLARGLDSHYQLHQQISTALEVARRPAGNEIEAHLLYNTDDLLVRMRRFVASQGRVPWREVETLVAIGLVALGLTVASGPLLPEAQSPVALPTLPPPVVPTSVAPPTPTPEPVAEQPPQIPPENQAAADAIADALRDNGATRSAADALDQGDAAQAASELRELADQAEQIGAQARRDIAEGLREAADQLRGERPDLASGLAQQAEALQRGGEEAAQALEDLARTVEELGQPGEQLAEASAPAGSENQPGPSSEAGSGQQGQEGQQNGGGSGAGDLEGEGRGAQPGDTAQAEGDTLPLPESGDTGGPTTPATGPRGPQIELGAGGTGETRNPGGNAGNQPLGGEPDPLRIPLEYRDVVEDYFSPQP